MEDLPDAPKARLRSRPPPGESPAFKLGVALDLVDAEDDLDSLLLELEEDILGLVLLPMEDLPDTPRGRLTLRPPPKAIPAPVVGLGLGLDFEDESEAA